MREPTTDLKRPKRAVRFPNLYVWLVLLSALDVMLTWTILHLGGGEANPIAARVIDKAGLPGMCAFKFAIVTLVIVLCEFIAKRNVAAAERLAVWSIALTTVPLVIALVLIKAYR